MKREFEVFKVILVILLATMPASTTYTLHNYSFGSGGAATSTSTNYSISGLSGEQNGVTVTSPNFSTKPGNNNSQTANVPTITISNPSSYYNELLIVIGTQNNPSDTLYVVEISTDNFATNINYIKSDNTIEVSPTYPTDYRTYSGWGSAGGTVIIGLTPSTTYYVRASAIQGKFSQSAYGPVSSVATVNPQLSFSVSPTTSNFGNLNAGSVITSSPNGSLTFATNADSGGNIYIASQNAALYSARILSSITSATTNLTSATSGYGVQDSSPTQTSGGPLTSVSPYNGSSNNVGALSATFQPLLTSAGPVFGGTATLLIMAKASNVTPAAPDYTDILTLVASGAF
ncbi:MAG: hypothetical protein ACHQUB_03550 [Candidatus Saccharimonadia bacterium]